MPKITALTANTTPLTTDIMPMVDDPGGTAATQKITIANLRSQLKPHAACGGRSTLTTGVPVTTADVTAATTLYFTPYSGSQFCGQVGLYDGSAKWDVVDFTEISLSLVGYTASKPYDIWVYNNSGTAALESTVWTNGTTRATALTTQNGIYVKSGATTRRYLGTIYINSSGGQTDDAVLYRFVWNYYNRIIRRMVVTDANSHAYTTGTWRYWNNNSALLIQFVIGVAENAIKAGFPVVAQYSWGAGVVARTAAPLDTLTASDNTIPYVSCDTTQTGMRFSSWASFAPPAVGYHYIPISQFGATTTTFQQANLEAEVLG